MTAQEKSDLLNQVFLIIVLSFWALLAWYEEKTGRGGRR